MKICEYGCGREGKFYYPTVGKWCCSKHHNQCSAKRKEISEANKGSKNGMFEKNHSEESRKKMSEANKGQEPWNKGKTGVFSEEALRRISEAKKGKNHPMYLTIEKIKEKYSFFSDIEEMRYNPDKSEEKKIQVHCKNHNCPNSKEKDGWFTPTPKQIQDRKNILENESEDKFSFYCSQYCKDTCPLYRLHGDSFKNTELPYTQAEKDIHNKEVLRRQKEEDGYNFCEKCYSTKKLHVHHEKPVKTHPHLALDPDNGIVLCKECHYKYGHKTGTECSTGSLANKIC